VKNQQHTSEAEAELKKVIAERDKAKAKLREREDEDRKALEAKAIEEGKIKELLATREAELAELKKYRDSVEAEKQARRAKVLDGIADPEVKKFAEKMSDASEIIEFTKLVEERKLTTHTGNNQKTAPEKPKFKSFSEYEQFYNNPGGGLIPKL
jgi:septal ring factor EnvC (AmiA/AmiB activator)